MNINETRTHIRKVKWFTVDKINDLADHEVNIIYNDISKISDILLERLIDNQNERELNKIC